jgi:tripartite-type tricarboxylate transporter receptor subunit TctC
VIHSVQKNSFIKNETIVASIFASVTATVVLSAAGLLVSNDAYAQSGAWPNKPIRLVVPFPPGGGTDTFARPLSKVLSQQLGQTVVIDNRGGAGGTLGAEIAAKSAPDGYTFLMGAVHHTIAVTMYQKLGYDLTKDLVAVSPVSFVPNVVVVNPSRIKANNIAEFIGIIKTNPGKFNYGSAGNGTTHHLTVEYYKTLTRSFATHVPYRGAGPALQDLLAGQVDFMFDGLGSSIQHIKAGKLKALAVSSAKRSFALPDVPTLAEAGITGYDAQTWYAIWAPAGTPKEIVAKMQQEIAKAMAGKEIRDIWNTLGAELGGQSSEDMNKLVASEITKWAKVVKDSGAKLD